jgi:hypothetical protein
MKAAVYKITLDDGSKHDVDGHSAAEAIEKALRQNLGRKVAKCYAGLTQQDADDARLVRDRLALPGLIEFDVPPHEAYPPPSGFLEDARPNDRRDYSDVSAP